MQAFFITAVAGGRRIGAVNLKMLKTMACYEKLFGGTGR